jgi:hypothetical protein
MINLSQKIESWMNKDKLTQYKLWRIKQEKILEFIIKEM